MLEFAAEQFRQSKTQGGASLADHEALLEQQGIKVEREQESAELPPLAEHVWRFFCEIHAGRQAGGFGPVPLAWSDIDAWARLTGRALAPWEIDALRALDAAWLTEALDRG